MKHRPILMSAPMVRAILSGTKTQTRRIIKCACNSMHYAGSPPKLLGEWSLSWPPHRFAEGGEDEEFEDPNETPWNWTGKKKPVKGDWIEQWQTDVDDHASGPVTCPYGQPGDRLWVRESFATDERPTGPLSSDHKTEVAYMADHIGDAKGLDWRPSIHMPRWASRLTLEITGVRVERLQDISEADAKAEGIQNVGDQCWIAPGTKQSFNKANCEWDTSPKRAFKILWESINCPESWEQNPWVWVVEFKRVQP